MATLSLVTPPATEPLTVAEVKQHLRLDATSGEPCPTVPTVALVTAAGAITSGVHRWAWVARTADGSTELGGISAPLTTDTATHGQATVTKPVGGSNVTYMDAYRTAAGGSTYLFVAATANDGALYTDNISDGSLGAQAPTVNTTLDPEITGWITAARQYCETFTHRALITQTYDLKLDSFPWNSPGYVDAGQIGVGAIGIPKAPLQSVTSLTYIDTNGAVQTWDSSNYTVDAPAGPWAAPGRLVPAWSIYYPVCRTVPNAIVVRFVAGYGAASAVPYPIKQAMKLLIGNWYVNHEAGALFRGTADVLPYGIDALLWPFKAF